MHIILPSVNHVTKTKSLENSCVPITVTLGNILSTNCNFDCTCFQNIPLTEPDVTIDKYLISHRAAFDPLEQKSETLNCCSSKNCPFRNCMQGEATDRISKVEPQTCLEGNQH